MHRPIFGHSFAVLVAPVLLSVLAFKFLNKKKTSARRDAEDVDISASDSITASTEGNSDGSSLSPTKTDDVASSSSMKETNNGASSPLTMSTGNCYEVFLSFRGPDTRKGFTDHLYHGLLDAGIHAFRDDDEVPEGENIKPELLAAIRNSKILIPILSETYGTSSWCLDELVQIMECKNNNGHIVLPIFYKVKPTDVRNQNGNFGEAFRKRERSSFDSMILEKWKKALNEVSALRGYEDKGYDAQSVLVNSVVREVLLELKKKFELVISRNLVGIDSHVNKVMEFVDNKSNATLFVGIHGMGGIGKTTLAKTIYNKLSNQFEHRSFIADVRESWKRNGVHYLQNQLIYHIFNRENEVCNEDEGTQLISSKFKGKKVLILLDDVDNVVQLKSLAGNRNWFSSGSRIIITTRNKRVLEEAGVDHDYEHKEMDKNQSLILFSRHAFRRDSPPREFKDLTHEAISIIGGLPLSLEVFGSLLCGKESRWWRDRIKYLKEIPLMNVQEKLLISYQALTYEQKYIFLDIACFFIGFDEIIASYMWDACGFLAKLGIEELIFMSLIKVGNDHKLRMHDQLRDLGREIVRNEDLEKPSDRSRLWDHKEVQKVLKYNEGTRRITGINLGKGYPEVIRIVKRDGNSYEGKQFKNLTNLRFLHLDGAYLSGDFEYSMQNLSWLQWPFCPMNFEVNNFRVKRLAVLELPHGKINEKWEGWSFFMMAKKLKYLDLSSCNSLEGTDFLSAFKELEVLILNGCRRLKRIDASIGEMEALLCLKLRGCESLTELPAEICNLKVLQQLNLEGTRSLSALPDSIGCLENLEILEISWSGIEELPNSMGRLRNLRELHAFQCNNLKGIMAKSICNPSSLRRLDFCNCDELQSLPDLPSSLTYLGITCQSRKLPSLSHLAHLKELQVWGCRFLQCIQELPSMLLKSSECSQLTKVEESESPQSLNTPFKLEILTVHECKSIERLDVSWFIHLRKLYVRGCENLLEVRGLDKSICLESLTIIFCDSIKRLDLPKFEGMKKLIVEGCDKLAEIQGFDRPEYLESLDIELCTSTERLDLPKCRKLKKLLTRGCKNLAEIEGLDRSECLESLVIEGCTSIERLDLPKSGRLKGLDAGKCENLVEIQGLDGSEYLERLCIEGCTLMERLYLPKSRRLKELQASGCKNLTEIQGLNRSEYLERLDIKWCTSMERLYLPKSGRLKKLKVRGCKNLAEIQGLDRSEYLESLDIGGWTSIERIDLPKFGRLMELNAGGCKNLAEIQGLDTLEYLESLDISRCTSIGRLNLPQSRSMKILYADSCKKLAKIQGLDRLESLERLDISGCTSIERLLLPQSESLKILEARDCENLIEIQGLDRLKFLEELNIIGCKSLKTIPELSRTRIYRYYEIADRETMEYEWNYMDVLDQNSEGSTFSNEGT